MVGSPCTHCVLTSWQQFPMLPYKTKLLLSSIPTTEIYTVNVSASIAKVEVVASDDVVGSDEGVTFDVAEV